jgi:hypothetical protein
MSRLLTSEAETLRKQIKDIIFKADKGDPMGDVDRLETKDGRILYVGQSLTDTVGELMGKEGIKTSEWGFTVWHFPNNRRLGNPNKNMQLVPLSANSTLLPGEALAEGSLTHVTHAAPMVSSGSTLIIFLELSK